jgi:hypothetical protein
LTADIRGVPPVTVLVAVSITDNVLLPTLAT